MSKDNEDTGNYHTYSADLTDRNQGIVDKHHLTQLTVWSDRHEEITCQYGLCITMDEYCRLEKQRIEEGGMNKIKRKCAVLKQDGYVSLWVDEPVDDHKYYTKGGE